MLHLETAKYTNQPIFYLWISGLLSFSEFVPHATFFFSLDSDISHHKNNTDKKVLTLLSFIQLLL
jgi:hypothetical protein